MAGIPPARVLLDIDGLSIEEVANRLAADHRVWGVLLFGSANEEGFNAASDYDLAVVASVPEVPVSGLLTRIDGRLCDVVFVDAAEVRRWLATELLPPGNYWRQGLRRWVVEGTILFERDRLLSRLRSLSAPLSWFTSPTPADLHAMWFAGYYRLKQLQRQLSSSSEPTRLYIDLRLGFFIHQAVQFHFAVRDYPWTGTHRALKWLKDADPKFFALVRTCLDESDRHKKWAACARLFDQVMEPIGAWPEGVSGVTFNPGAPIDVDTVPDTVRIIGELFGTNRNSPASAE